jgi:putative transposase
MPLISFVIARNRTPLEYVGYGLYLYFSGLSLRRALERLSCFVKRNYVSIWNWIQKHKPTMVFSRRKKISEFVIDNSRTNYIQRKKHACRWKVISGVVKPHWKHPVSTDGETWYPQQPCRFLKIKHYIHSPFEKSLVERTIRV